MERKDREILDNSFITSIFVSSRNIGWLLRILKPRKSVGCYEEGDRPQTHVDRISQKGVFLRRIGKMGLKWQNLHDVIDLPIERVNALSPYKVYINNNGSLGFETQYGSVYEVGFVEDYTFMDENAFQFFYFWNHKVSIL